MKMKLSFTHLFATAIVSSSVYAQHPSACEDDVKSLECIWNGDWGTWWGLEGNGANYRACGAELQFEDKCGSCDDTAANGLRMMFCNFTDWNQQERKEMNPGKFGTWKGMKMCKPGYYVDGAQVKYEDKQGGGDDTALNGLKIHCRKKASSYGDYWIIVYEGEWGEWKPRKVNEYHFVSKAQVRVEEAGGSDVDDTMLNGIAFYYAKPVTTSRAEGYWKMVNSGCLDCTNKFQASTFWEMSKESTEEYKKEITQGIKTSISSGFSFKGFSATATVTGDYTAVVAEYASRTLTQKMGTSRGVEIECNGDIYQWSFHAKDDNQGGSGWHVDSNLFKCVSFDGNNRRGKPVCPPDFCANVDCTFCEDDFYKAFPGWPTLNPTASPTVKPTLNPTTSPTFKTTLNPTASPTIKPTFNPTASQTFKPTASQSSAASGSTQNLGMSCLSVVVGALMLTVVASI